MADPAAAWKPVQEAPPSAWTPVKEDQPVLPRALANLPSSLLHFGQNITGLGVGAHNFPALDAQGNPTGSYHVSGPFEDIGNMLGGLAGIALSPEESFAQDPVGTIGYPLMALKGGHEFLTQTAPGAGVRGAASATKAQVRPLLENADLIHPFKMIPSILDAIKHIGEGGRSGMEAFKSSRLSSDLSGNPTVGRFDPSQYGSPVDTSAVETGGGHVPDYTGPVLQPLPPPDMPGMTMNPAYHGPIQPIHPSTVDISSSLESSPIQPVAPAPQGEIVRGLHLPEVPSHYAGEPNPTAAFKNDQAIVAELRKVPGITQDSLTPEMVHEVRKALGQRPLKPADIERRVEHIRLLLPK